MNEEVRALRDQVFKALIETNRHDSHSTREGECIDQVAKEGNTELLTIFLNNMDSIYSVRSMKNAYDEIVNNTDVSPSLLINDHGMKMREIIQTEMIGDFFSHIMYPISVMAMSLTEDEVHRVVLIMQRGIIGVENIRELLREAESVNQPLRDGTL